MDANQYCTYQDVVDILPSSVIGTNPGQVSEAQIRRLIIKKSAEIEFWNNKIPFAKTTNADEYYELCGIDKFALNRSPVISITKLEIQQSDDTWEEQTQGRDDDTDDYFLEDTSWGLIRFHSTPTKYTWCRVTYVYGYTDIPYWLRDLCSKMVACDIFKLKNFDESCETLFKYWLDEIREYKKDINQYKDKIDQRKMIARTIGARWATTSLDELSQLRNWNE